MYWENMKETLVLMNHQFSLDIQELCGLSLAGGLRIAFQRDAKRISSRDGFLGGQSGSRMHIPRYH